MAENQGYGETADYGELDYKGEVYGSKDYSEEAVTYLLEQYKKEYTNG